MQEHNFFFTLSPDILAEKRRLISPPKPNILLIKIKIVLISILLFFTHTLSYNAINVESRIKGDFLRKHDVRAEHNGPFPRINIALQSH